MSASCDRETFQRLAVASVGYACGRASYLPSTLCRYLESNLGALDPETEREIIATISERAGRGPDVLGRDIGRTVWGDLVEALRGNLDRPEGGRGPDTGDGGTFWLMVGSALRHDKASDVPELSASAYRDLVLANEGTIGPEWTANLLRDVAEAYGKDWWPEAGPARDPAGFASLYGTLAGIWERSRGPLPDHLTLDASRLADPTADDGPAGKHAADRDGRP